MCVCVCVRVSVVALVGVRWKFFTISWGSVDIFNIFYVSCAVCVSVRLCVLYVYL